MEKQVRIADEKRGIIQVTTYDERWYCKQGTDPKTKLPTYDYVPSVTWVTGHYPKGTEFYKWLAKNGWDESIAIRDAAASKGSAIHKGVERLLQGEVVKMDDEYTDPKTGEMRPLEVEEYYGIMTFVDWYKDLCSKHVVEVVGSEIVIWNDEDNYAGTVDLVLRVDGRLLVIDLKSGQNIWPEYTLQLSAYRKALELAGNEVYGQAVLQLGFKRNKKGWKYNEIDYKYDLYLAAKRIWENEAAGVTVHQRDYPVELDLSDMPIIAMEAEVSAEDVPVAEAKDEAPEIPVMQGTKEALEKVTVKKTTNKK